MATPDAAARLKEADKLDHLARRSWLMLIPAIPAFLLVASDLVSHWFGLPRRVDVGVLLVGCFSPVGPLTLRQLSRRLRSGEAVKKSTRGQWVRAGFTTAACLVFVGAVGYLIEGWILALLLPAGTVALTVWSVMRVFRRRQNRPGGSH